jgi:hypothetical protein
MKRRRRIFYSATQRSDIWDRWQVVSALADAESEFIGMESRQSASGPLRSFRECRCSPVNGRGELPVDLPQNRKIGRARYGYQRLTGAATEEGTMKAALQNTMPGCSGCWTT